MMQEKKTMRDAFIEEVYKRMHIDDRIFFVSADFGAPTLDALRSSFKDRFINVGIAEQNLINVATGLGLEGFTVYAYAIAPFITMRAYEQIRTNLSLYAQLKEINVNLIGVGAGLSYDVSGPTHHCLEDIILMRTLPNFTVFSPSDWVLAQQFVDYSLAERRPKYLRFDGKPVAGIYNDGRRADLQAGFAEIRSGEKVCIVSTGYMTHTALQAVQRLADDHVNAGVIDIFMLKPINDDLLFKALARYSHIVTLEEGFIEKGGLDSLVAHVLEKNKSAIPLKRLGFQDRYVFEMGNRQQLHRLHRLDEQSIADVIKEIIVTN
jgi:transketolase